MTNGLLVRIDEDVVGRLWLDEKKRFCFQYDKEWLEQSRSLCLSRYRLQFFKGAFSSYKCDALYRLMQLMGEQAEKNIRKLA